MDAEITRLREALAWAVAYINTELSMSGSRRGQNAAIDGVIDWVEKRRLLKDAALAGTSADAGARETAYVTTSSATQGDVYMVVNGVFTCLKCGNKFTFPTSPMTHDTNDAGGGAVAMCPKGTPATDAQLIELRKWWDAFACENTPLAIHRMASEYIEAREALEMMRDVRVGLIAERDRLRAFVASLKAKAQQSIIITPRHFEAFERGET
jgi:hypothetical protein